MRVLGIDPGSRHTGLGVVDVKTQGLCHVTHNKISPKPASLPEKLGVIFRGVEEMIDHYQPDIVSVEQVFISNNAKSALVLGQARGAAIAAAMNRGCHVVEYSALQIKRAVVGTGAAKKEQVQHMVRVLLGLREFPPEDSADALACAICHIHTDQVEQKLNKAAAS